MQAPPHTIGFAAAGLALCAAVGLFLGATKAAPTGADYRSGALDAGGVPTAKPIAAAGNPALDEAAVRRIAREEAKVALGASVKRADATPTAATKYAGSSTKIAKADQTDAAPDDAQPAPAPPRHHKPRLAAPSGATSDAPSAGEVPVPSATPAARPATPPDQY